jgi:hypothetical protein
MRAVRWGMSLVAMIGVLAATIAGATIWLLVTDPVTVSDAVAKGDVSAIVTALSGVLRGALSGIFKYL